MSSTVMPRSSAISNLCIEAAAESKTVFVFVSVFGETGVGGMGDIGE